MNADLWLVITNILYLVPAVVLLYKSWGNKTLFGAEIWVFLTVGLASSSHHLCDTRSIDVCWRAAGELYLFDVFFSYLAILMSVVPFYSERLRSAAIGCNIFGAFSVILAFNDGINGAIIVVGVAAVGLIVAEISQLLVDRSPLKYLLPTASLVVLAVVFKNMSDDHDPNDGTSDYRLYHSLWHAFTAIAPAVLYLGLSKQTVTQYCKLATSSQASKTGLSTTRASKFAPV